MIPNLPLTKEISKAAPYAGPVPSYIQLRDDEASAAGLTVTRLQRRDGYLVSVFAGSRDQIRGFARVWNAGNLTWPRRHNRPSAVSVESRSPIVGRSSLFRINEDRFAIQLMDILPDKWRTTAFGVECFIFNEGDQHGWERHSYVGTKQDLLRAKLTDEEFFPDDSTEEGRLRNRAQRHINGPEYHILVEEIQRLTDGYWAYSKFPHASAKAERRKAELASRPTYNSPNDFRAFLLRFIEATIEVTQFTLFSQKQCRAGKTYRLSEKSAAAVRARMDALFAEVQGAAIACDGEKRPALRLIGGRDT